MKIEKSRILYRYISFEQFIDMFQKQALTFVLPEKWEDPTEKVAFDTVIESINDHYMRCLLEIHKFQTFCQCWTILDESDAMWRIYSYDRKAIRICTTQSDLVALDANLVIKNVEYSDERIIIPTGLDKESPDYGNRIGQLVLQSLCHKRTAFSHEKEVRLIMPSPINNATPPLLIDYIIAYFSIVNPDRELVDMLCEQRYSVDRRNMQTMYKLLNYGQEKHETKDVSFANNPHFLKGVMVHPQAPDWYVDTVRSFCDNHLLPFEGKSKLYS